MDFVPSAPPMIPSIIVHCVNEIEQRGLHEVKMRGGRVLVEWVWDAGEADSHPKCLLLMVCAALLSGRLSSRGCAECSRVGKKWEQKKAGFVH